MAYKEIVKRDGEFHQRDFIGDTAGKAAAIAAGEVKDTDTYFDVEAGTFEIRYNGAWYDYS